MKDTDSDTTLPCNSAGEFAERREFVRRSVLRANRAVAIILAVVVLLGGVLVIMSLHARRNQARAEKAEDEATERLWRASAARARAETLSTLAGHRAAALEAVRAAAAIRPSVELRNVAITALGLRDLVREREWTLRPNAYGFNFDPDLEFYLVRYTAETLSMFRLADNSHVRDFTMPAFLPKGSNVGDFTFSATGKHVAIRYNGGAVVLWERDTGEQAHVLGRDDGIRHYSWPPSFTADGRLMCLTMTVGEATAVLYDLEKREPRRLEALPADLKFTGFQNRVAISGSGEHLAWFTGPYVHILDAATGAVKHTITGPSHVQTLDWDERGHRLAFSCDNSTLFVWEAKSGRLQQMGGKTVQPWVQRFSADGTLLVTAGNDGMTRLWDLATAQIVSQTNDGRATTLARDGQRIAWGVPGRRVGVWRIEQPAGMRFRQGRILERATVWQNDFAADGRRAVWSPPSWTSTYGFELLDLRDGGSSIWIPAAQKVVAGFHPAKCQLWTAGAHGLTFHDLPASGLPEAAALKTPAGTLPLPAGFVPFNASFSADGRFAAVVGSGGRVAVVDAEAPATPVMLEGGIRGDADIPGPGSPTGSGAMAVSPDGRWVVGGRGTPRGNPAIWDARTGKLVKSLSASFAHAAFSADGRWLTTIGVNTARVYRTGDWNVQWSRPRQAMLGNYGAAAFPADGSLIAWTRSVDVVELSETASGTTVAELSLAPLGVVTGLRFAADGSRLFAGGTEGRLMTLDLSVLRQHLAAVNLDWPLAPASGPPVEGIREGPSALLPAMLGIVPVGIAAILGVLVLRRQGRLTREFVEATEVASRRARELAAEREVGELKSRFVTTVSHEFRTPLGITMSAIELLRHYEDRLPAAERHQLFDDIHSATRNMAGLMEQVLVLGRVDAGKLAYKPAPVDLDALARKLTDESLSATNRKCRVEWTAENDLSGAFADEALLRHIFSNLLSNAVKYSPGGTTVRFTGRREDDTAVFAVHDEGIGIPDEDLPRLFEAFHRGSNVGDVPGTGLGLVIIKRCVELHQGSIRVDSKPEEGTTFTVRLPAWNANPRPGL